MKDLCALIQSSPGAFTMSGVEVSKDVIPKSAINVPHLFATIGELLMQEGT
jgi:hypothetical protein